jgi:porin
MTTFLFNRKMHRWAAVGTALPVIIVIASGLVLQLKKTLLISLLLFLSIVTIAQALEDVSGSKIKPRFSTDEVENQITLDRDANSLYESRLLVPIHKWKNEVAENTGLNWSLDYTTLVMSSSGSPGEDNASSGNIRFFGYWDLVNRGSSNKGSLNWKVENRHSYTDVPPSGLGFESGYVGLFEPPFSDQQTRLDKIISTLIMST